MIPVPLGPQSSRKQNYLLRRRQVRDQLIDSGFELLHSNLSVVHWTASGKESANFQEDRLHSKYLYVILCINSLITVGVIQIAVKTISGLTRGLRVIEAIAAHQPIGLTALSRLLEVDKSAMQRTLATLHEAQWIHPVGEAPPRWELSTRCVVVAGQVYNGSSLAARAQPVMTKIRDTTGETVHLAVAEEEHMIVLGVVEGTHMVRTGLKPGQIHVPETSAAGRVIHAYQSQEERMNSSGQPDLLLADAEYQEIRRRGWAASEEAVQQGSTSLAAAVLDASGSPLAAIVISGPATRLTEEYFARYGELLRSAADQLGGSY
nr:IclR family transcriptional regulator [Rhodococcus sp. MS16]